MAPCCSYKLVYVKKTLEMSSVIAPCSLQPARLCWGQVLREEPFNEQDMTPDLKDFKTLLTELKAAHHRIEFHCYNNQDHYY